jgi:hypothetical protein
LLDEGYTAAPEAEPIVSTKLAALAARARRARLTNVVQFVDEELLRLAFRSLRKRAAPGVDRQSYEDYAVNLDQKLRELHTRLKRQALSNIGTSGGRPTRRNGVRTWYAVSCHGHARRTVPRRQRSVQCIRPQTSQVILDPCCGISARLRRGRNKSVCGLMLMSMHRSSRYAGATYIFRPMQAVVTDERGAFRSLIGWTRVSDRCHPLRESPTTATLGPAPNCVAAR